jgi:sugar lactone lactonase YvrE
MKPVPRASGPSSKQTKAVSICTLMLLSSLVPILISPASASHSTNVVDWPESGYNDTGWVQLDAIGAGASIGQGGSIEWTMDFVAGADLSNLTMEIRVDGANGLSIDEPLIYSDDNGQALFDWTGQGTLGQSNSFNGANPHTGRLNPDYDNGANWNIPAGSVITDLVFEALAPADPAVSLQPIDIEFTDSLIHPADGRLIICFDEVLVTLDANSNPPIIDVMEFSNVGKILDLELDIAGDRILVVTRDDGIHAISASTSSTLNILPAPPTPGDVITQVYADANGNIWGFSPQGVHTLDNAQSGWILEQTSGSPNWPYGLPTGVFEDAGVLYVPLWSYFVDDMAFSAAGVARWDIGTNSPLSSWSTANDLHSDQITDIIRVGNQLFFASKDAGIGRYDAPGDFWKAPWDASNWLLDNTVAGLEVDGDELFILGNENVQIYSVSTGSFSTSISLTSLTLGGEGRNNIVWPSGGSRAPMDSTILITDGSGRLAKLVPGSIPLHQGMLTLGSGPSSADMIAIVEIGSKVYVASEFAIDVFDKPSNTWIQSLPFTEMISALSVSGTDLLVGMDEDGLNIFDSNSLSTAPLHLGSGDGLASDSITGITGFGSTIITTHFGDGLSLINMSAANPSITIFDTDDDIDSVFLNDVAIVGGIAYAASEDNGIIRIDLGTEQLLSSWISTGVVYSQQLPLAITNDILHVGLWDYGVARKNLITGEILTPLQSTPGGGGNGNGNGGPTSISSNEINALWTDTTTGNLYIATQRSLESWDGNSITELYNDRTYQTYDITNTGTYIYTATNSGLCRYTKSNFQFEECFTDDDGLPDTDVRSVVNEDPTLYVGTTGGVALFGIYNDTIYETWESGASSDGVAETAIIDNIVYVGLNNIGLARYDLTTSDWLQTWDGTLGVIDDIGITSITRDSNPNRLWVGGGNGIQLIDVVNSTEILHWADSSSQYPGTRNPYQMVITNDVLYYRYQWQWGDGGWSEGEIRRIDLSTQNALTSLDTADRFGITGYTYGMGLTGDILTIGVSEYAQGNNQPDGGIVQWNTSSGTWMADKAIEAEVNDVETLRDSSGDLWVSWGERSIVRYNSTGVETDFFDSADLDLPIRAIVEWDSQILFASEDGVKRWDMQTDAWTTTWTAGNGLPNDAEDEIDELEIIDGSLWIGTSSVREQWWGSQFLGATILRLDSAGSWDSWTQDEPGVENGYAISLIGCGGWVFAAMLNNNAGLSMYDGSQWSQASNQDIENDDDVNSVACDDQDILYVGYSSDGRGISRFDVANDVWLTPISTQSAGVSDGGTDSDGLIWFDGDLFVGHEKDSGWLEGGLSVIPSSGSTYSSGFTEFGGAAVSAFSTDGTNLLIGQGGQGLTRVITHPINSYNSFTILIDTPGLEDGWISDAVGNSTHLYVATNDLGFGGGGGNTGIMEGIRNSTGVITWTQTWSTTGLPIKDLEFDGNTLWASITGLGLVAIDLSTGSAVGLPSGLHNYVDGISIEGDQIAVGLESNDFATAGVEVWNTSSSAWDAAALMNGLPSNLISSFTEIDDYVFIGTNSGIGIWNKTIASWDAPLTMQDGLSSNNIQDLSAPISSNGDYIILYITTPEGVDRWLIDSEVNLGKLTASDGMIGTDAHDILLIPGIGIPGSNVINAYISHRGSDLSRPGITTMEIDTQGTGNEQIIEHHRFDQLPSNTVQSLTSDSWGVHVATTESPIVHYNMTSTEFENGVALWQLSGTQVTGMYSDGTRLLITSNDGATLVQASLPNHQLIRKISTADLSSGIISIDGAWLIGEDGLERWSASGVRIDEINMRRAMPLTANIGNYSKDISEFTHPGNQISYFATGESYTLNEFGFAGPHGITVQSLGLVLASPSVGAATWAQMGLLNYRATLNLSDDSSLMPNFQNMVDKGRIINGSSIVTLVLSSPSNGSLEVRMTYDWVKTETPISMISFEDKPDDGGAVLLASWSLVHDADFDNYLIYLSDSEWANNTDTTDLLLRTVDGTISQHETLNGQFDTANGVPLVDGQQYWALIVVEYNDGRFGTPSSAIGPSSPIDNVPMSPYWMDARPFEGGMDGDLELEWSRCTANDISHANVYASSVAITDVVSLSPDFTLLPIDGNTTIISLEAGRPYWIAMTCVDDAGQEDLLNPTIIGPVIPTGGINDGIPPSKLTDVWAMDVADDDGGVIEAGWGGSIADDCAFITVYITEKIDDVEKPTSVIGFSVAKIITNCEEGSTYISMIEDELLIDDTTYWVGMVASDKWLNADIGDVTILEVTPFTSSIVGIAPDRITLIDAWDHAGDDGTAIDVSWTASDAPDFAYYTIWASEHMVDDLRDLEQSGSIIDVYYPDSIYCACLVIDKQTFSADEDKIQIIMETALYGGNGLSQSEASSITPGIELHVTVTVHDLKGNVHIFGLSQASVIPIDNQNDDEAPSRIDGLTLEDRLDDDGSALLLEFTPSGDSDIHSYEIYAASRDFSAVGANSNGPRNPILTIVDRYPSMPIIIENLSDGNMIVKGIEITVAVVAVDSAGNAYLDNLNTASAIALADGDLDDSSNIPEIEGVTVKWVVDEIYVSWTHSDVRGYMVYMSASNFTNIEDASLMGTQNSSNLLVISADMFTGLNPENSYWIGVSAMDDDSNKKNIVAYELMPAEKEDSGTGVDDGLSQSESTQFSDLMTPEAVLIGAFVLIIAVLLLLVIRGGGRGGRDKNYELQEATWGIQARSGWDDSVGFSGAGAQPTQAPQAVIAPQYEQNIIGAAQRIDNQSANNWQQPEPQSTQPAQPQGGQSSIDTSFLDDLL